MVLSSGSIIKSWPEAGFFLLCYLFNFSRERASQQICYSVQQVHLVDKIETISGLSDI